ncbi:alcohol dehydrogenase catalytic domain-containing protein [Arthrobacter sp. AK01]|nr:alcohol dehydrogenase catalytic domain-containing protein [Arthrobacter sp. AK01]
MCGSDLHAYRGPHLADPFVAGHEPAGVIVEVGSDVSTSWIGKSVMVHHYFGCGRCDQCRSGWTQMCREGSVAMGTGANGAHSDLISVPFNTVMPMPEGLTYLAAAAVSCGTGTAWRALKRLNLAADDTLAIFGQGPVGLAATQLATAMGARVVAMDISETRLERAKEFGAWESIDPSQVGSVADTIRDLNNGIGVSKSLETSGASSAAVDVLNVLDTWGQACWVGVGSTINFRLTDHLYRQVSGFASWTMSVPDMMSCARFIVDRGVDVDSLFTERWTLADAVRAYELFDQQAVGKGAFLS